MPGIEFNNKRIPCRLVIFDKDGTLIDFAATWVPLIRKRITLLLKALGRDGEMKSLLLRAWGIDPASGRIDPRGPVLFPQAGRDHYRNHGTLPAGIPLG